MTELLVECARLLEKAERYELLGEIYRFIIPIYERNRDFEVCIMLDAYCSVWSQVQCLPYYLIIE